MQVLKKIHFIYESAFIFKIPHLYSKYQSLEQITQFKFKMPAEFIIFNSRCLNNISFVSAINKMQNPFEFHTCLETQHLCRISSEGIYNIGSK